MGLSDMMARGAAAQSLMNSAPSGMPPAGPAMDEAPMPEDQEPPDINSALDEVEASLDGMDSSIAEEVRTHLNAIRELVSQDVGAGGAPPDASLDASIPPAEPSPPITEDKMLT